MFQKTEAEAEALSEVARIEAAMEEARQELRRLGYSAGSTAREEAESAIQKLKAEREMLMSSEPFLVAQLKGEINRAVADKMPGGSVGTILTLVEESVLLLDAENVKRVGGVLRSIAVRFFDTLADAEVQAARARVTKARYDALINTGLPDPFVQNLMVAEAYRPWPSTPSVPSSKR